MPARADITNLFAVTADPPGGTGNAISYVSPGAAQSLESTTNTIAQFQIDPDDNIASDNQKVILPILAAAVTVTADTGTEKLSATGHGIADYTPGYMETSGTLPAPFTTTTVYYVRDAATNDFKLSTAPGGTAVNITTTGTGTHKFRKLAAVAPTYEYPTTGPQIPVQLRQAPTGEPPDFRTLRALQVILLARDEESDASGTVHVTFGDPTSVFTHFNAVLKLAYTAADENKQWPSALITFPAGFTPDTDWPLFVRTKAGESNTNLRVILTLLGT